MTGPGTVHSLGDDVLALRRLRTVVGAVVGIAASAAFSFGLSRWVIAEWPWWILVVLVATASMIEWFWVAIDHRRWSWRLDDELFEVRRGVVVDRTYLVPRNRIQNVTTTAGPLQSRFGVVSLTVHTAGARTRNVSISDLDAGHAQAIRRRLGLA